MAKIALLGAGRIGRIHAANAAAHPALKLADATPAAHHGAKAAPHHTAEPGDDADAN